MPENPGNILAKQIAVDEFIKTVLEMATANPMYDPDALAFLEGFLEMCKIPHFANLAMEEYMDNFQRRFPGL